MKEREIPVLTTYNVATFDILIDGDLVDPGYQVLSISIMNEINKLPTAKIILKDGDSAEESFRISEQEEFLPGKSIAIKLGRDGENEQLFKGIIVKHGVKVKESGETELQLECRDAAVKMTIGRHNHYYEERKDSEIIEEIIERYDGLLHDVEPTNGTHFEMVQHHCTDWDFMMTRAEVNGKFVVVDNGTINIKAPETNADPALAVLFGSTLIDFEAEMDARNQWTSVEARSWDYAGQDVFEHVTDSVPINEPGNVSGQTLAESLSPEKIELRHSGQAIEEELQEWTKAMMQRSRLAKIQGRAKLMGFPNIKPGQLLELQGVGLRFIGNAFVSAVRQDVYNGSWYTQVQFGLKPDCFQQLHKDVIDFSAAGLVPAVKGLQIGKVVQLQDDPDGENRILVRLPIVDNSARGVWARVATLDAGSGETNGGRGSFFLPEVEDEVIVGFVNDDPRDAVVLGMLNSSAMPAALEAQDDNHEKAFVTRSKMRVHFNDDTKTITIDTPAGNSIMLDEDSTSIVIKDQNDNQIKLQPEGININSPKDINISASGDINIKSDKNIKIQSTLSLEAKASSTLELKGSASAKLAADGMTEIKGSMININ